MSALMDNLEFARVYIKKFACYYIGLIRGALRQGRGDYEVTPLGWDQMQY